MDIKGYIDNSILKPNVSYREVEEFVKASADIGFYAVCVNPAHVKLAYDVGAGDIKVCSVVGFPLGLSSKEVKLHEALRAVSDGAHEIDVVMNISAFKSGMYGKVEEELRSIVREAAAVIKVIIETCYLEEEEKITATKIVRESGAHYVKTSTGFGSGGATKKDVSLLKRLAGKDLKVKAAGGIRDLKTALEMIEAGADRIGTSNGFSIWSEFSKEKT